MSHHIYHHNLIDLQDHTTSADSTPINIVEFYVCKKPTGQSPGYIDINIPEDYITSIEAKFKNAKIASYKSYYMRDKIYTYELADDNQVVTSKYKVSSKYISRDKKPYDFFVVSSKIEKFPPYTFPCTNEIDHICSYTIKEYKINNRISVAIRSEEDIHSLYVEYRHSENVELDKMNEIINKTIKSL